MRRPTVRGTVTAKGTEPSGLGSSRLPPSMPPPEAQQPDVQAPQPGRAAFIFIFITVALDMLALGVIVPVLPKLVVELSGGDAADGARMYGFFGTAWALMQLVFSPVLGSLSDRFGRRPVILL